VLVFVLGPCTLPLYVYVVAPVTVTVEPVFITAVKLTEAEFDQFTPFKE
jgi:hypothetical protein